MNFSDMKLSYYYLFKKKEVSHFCCTRSQVDILGFFLGLTNSSLLTEWLYLNELDHASSSIHEQIVFYYKNIFDKVATFIYNCK
jgi:hypothetical protein